MNAPNHLPMRATTSVKTWLDLNSFGFLWNPDKDDTREIFVHRDCVPERPRIGQRLTITEIVHVTYVQDGKGRLKATKIEFPNPETYTFTLNGRRDLGARIPSTVNHQPSTDRNA